MTKLTMKLSIWGKAGTLFVRMLSLFVAVFFFGVSFLCVFQLSKTAIYTSRTVLYGYGVAGIFACFSLVGLYYLGIRRKWYGEKRCCITMLVLIFILQMAVYALLRPAPYTDCRSVVEAAMDMSRNGFHLTAPNSYFGMYGNNYFFTLLLSVLYYALRVTGIGHYWTVSVALNAILLDIGYGILSGLVAKRMNGKASFTFLFLCFANPMTYFLSWYVYTNLIGVFIMAMILLSLDRVFDGEKHILGWAVVGGTFIALSFLIRVTAFFVVIAALVCYVLLMPKNKGIWHYGKALAVMALTVGIVFAAWTLVKNACVDKALQEANFPVSHWLAMGSNPSGGSFDPYDEVTTQSIVGKQEKDAYNKALFLARVTEKLKNGTFVRFYLGKAVASWINPGFAVLQFAQTSVTLGSFFSCTVGKHSGAFQAYIQIYFMLTYLLAALAAVRAAFQRKLYFFDSVFLVTLFGAVVFYVIWEVKYSYCVSFIPFIGVIAAANQRQKLALPVKIGFDKCVLLCGGGLTAVVFAVLTVVPAYGNGLLNLVDDYSVCPVYRRADLESRIDTLCAQSDVIEENFVIPQGKTVGTLSFLVTVLTEEEDLPYTLTVLDAAGKAAAEVRLSLDQESGYALARLEEPLRPGQYTLHLSGDTGAEEMLAFHYSRNLIDIDWNPDGTPILSGKEMSGCELNFGAY